MEVQASARSNSSSGDISLVGKLKYNVQLLRFRMSQPAGKEAADVIHREVAGIADIYERETGKPAAQARVLEIGFGPRPQRAFGLTGFFKDVIAVDLDAPVLTWRDLPRVFRNNGFERGIKSLIRHMLFDAREWSVFHRTMQAHNPRYRPQAAQLVVGNAGSHATWDQFGGEVDLVFSTDVFEHIPPADLEVLVQTLRTRLAPGGIVITRPLIFTGISGGHDVPWYKEHVAGQTDGASAWGHLLDPDFSVNTYLNKFSRRDYVQMFERAGFTVRRDHALLGRLGEQWMSPQKRVTLADYDDYELYSNLVEFILR